MSEKVVGVVAAATTTNTNTEIYAALSNLMSSGIEIDKNLRQPTYYTWLDCDELKIDAFYIITDLLTHQKIPHWLSQRIGWYYSNKFFQEIVDDLSIANSDKLKNDSKCKLNFFNFFLFFNIFFEWFGLKCYHQTLNIIL